MKWFYDFKTRTKLLLSFGIVGVFLVFVAWLGVSGMSDLNNATLVLVNRDFLGASELSQAQTSFARVGRDTRHAFMEPDPDKMAAVARLFDQDCREFREHLEAAEKTLVQPSAKAKMAEVRAGWNEYEASQAEAIRLTRAGKNDVAIQAVERGATVRLKLESDLAALSKNKADLASEGALAADALYVRSRALMLGGAVAAVVFGLLLLLTVARSIAGPLQQAAGVLAKVAGGDFTQHAGIDTKDEIGELGKSLDAAVDSMRKALDEVRTVASEVASASQQLASASTEIAGGAQKQAASLEETAASLEEITSTVRQNADNAQHASQLASSSRDVAEKGGRVVESAVEAMGEITTASKKIAEIITAIDEIAFQTNLLALNAAVEAARAGEQGRGFAVVATEVRNLAQRSATAAKEIKGLIVDSVGKIETGSKHVNDSGNTLQEIVSSVKRVTDMVSEIAAASREQNTGVEQVNKAVTQMDQVTQQNASQTEELSATAESLTRQAEQLQSLVARFRLDDGATRREPAPVRAAPPPIPLRRRPMPASGKRLSVVPASDVQLAPTGTDGFDEF